MRRDPRYVLVDEGLVVDTDRIREVDLSAVEDLRVVIALEDPWEAYTVEGIQVIDLLMALRPSALEGKQLRWARHAWALHNLVGHPLMQLLAFFRRYKLAMWVHDVTVPRPRGRR